MRSLSNSGPLTISLPIVGGDIMNKLDERLAEIRKSEKAMREEIKKRKSRIDAMKFFEKILDSFSEKAKSGEVESFLRSIR